MVWHRCGMHGGMDVAGCGTGVAALIPHNRPTGPFCNLEIHTHCLRLEEP